MATDDGGYCREAPQERPRAEGQRPLPPSALHQGMEFLKAVRGRCSPLHHRTDALRGRHCPKDLCVCRGADRTKPDARVDEKKRDGRSARSKVSGRAR